MSGWCTIFRIKANCLVSELVSVVRIHVCCDYLWTPGPLATAIIVLVLEKDLAFRCHSYRYIQAVGYIPLLRN